MTQSLVRIAALPPVVTPDQAVLSVLEPFVPRGDVFTRFRYENVPYTLFLGRAYPPGQEPEQLRSLAEIPSQTERRSRYVALLSSALDAEPTPALQYERMVWERLYRSALSERVLARIDRLDEHMLWRDRTNRSGTPIVSIFAAHDMPVYRLLWPLYRSREPLPLNRIPRRTPNCPAEYGPTVLCVNPMHYYVAEPTQPAPHLRTKRGMIDYRTPKMSTYHDENGVWLCDRCGKPLSERSQHRLSVIEGMMPAHPYDTAQPWYGKPRPERMHCPTCYRRRATESGGLGRQLRGPKGYEDEPMPQETLDYAQWFTDRAYKRAFPEGEEPDD